METFTFEQLPKAIGLLCEKIDEIVRKVDGGASSTQTEGQDTLLDIEQAALLLFVTKSTIYKWVHSREIPYSKHSSRLYFSRRELINWAMQGRRKTTAELQAEASARITSPAKKKG